MSDKSAVVGGLSDLKRWYVVHTQQHREKQAAANLRRQAFEVFLPLHMRTVRHARRFSYAERAFFPRYLFTRLSPARDRWRPILGTIGVSGMVMEGERPLPVSHGVVERLIEHAGPSGVLTVDPALAVGDKVRLTNGPFAGLVGTLAAFDDQRRVTVLLSFLGSDISVSSGAIGLVPAA